MHTYETHPFNSFYFFNWNSTYSWALQPKSVVLRGVFPQCLWIGTHRGFGLDHVIRALAAAAVFHSIPCFLIEDDAEEENKRTLKWHETKKEESQHNDKYLPFNMLQGESEGSPAHSWSLRTGSGRWSCRCWRRGEPENMWRKPVRGCHLQFSGLSCRTRTRHREVSEELWGGLINTYLKMEADNERQEGTETNISDIRLKNSRSIINITNTWYK